MTLKQKILCDSTEKQCGQFCIGPKSECPFKGFAQLDPAKDPTQNFNFIQTSQRTFLKFETIKPGVTTE